MRRAGLSSGRPRLLQRARRRASVDFVVVGGVAAVVHGSATFTHDLDITYAPDAENLDRLGRALVALGARLRGVTDDVPFIPGWAHAQRTRVLTLDTPLGPIDLLAQPGRLHRRTRTLRERAVVEGSSPVCGWPFASLDDLIAMDKGRRAAEGSRRRRGAGGDQAAAPRARAELHFDT